MTFGLWIILVPNSVDFTPGTHEQKQTNRILFQDGAPCARGCGHRLWTMEVSVSLPNELEPGGVLGPNTPAAGHPSLRDKKEVRCKCAQWTGIERVEAN